MVWEREVGGMTLKNLGTSKGATGLEQATIIKWFNKVRTAVLAPHYMVTHMNMHVRKCVH